jgi:GalNAc-alpha-(1->4)-GalNAc-alpha-(1->3)-diNAcBac-PP-undecaprenol alpha-1,4-N-acetyl-D-galactosaminyltransferase
LKVSKQKKKICLVIPSLQAGGMERVMSELAWYFSEKEEVELHLLLYGISRQVFYSLPENVMLHSPSFKFSNRLRFLNTIRTLAFLRKSIRKIAPDTILSFGEYWNNFVLLALLGLKYPVYLSDRSQPDKSLGAFHDRMRHWLYPGSRGLILQTEMAKEIYLRKNRHDNIAVIGNPIRSFGEVKNGRMREKHVLMVGRLIQTKHQDMLIEMFARVCRHDWKLVIVGYDHMKQQHMDRLKGLARELRVEKQVVFMGKQDKIEEIYLRSSIFAFTSSSEGFPNVIGEAMSAGLPVVAFDCVAGPSEMIQDGKNGFLSPLFNKEDFQGNLARLMDDPELRIQMGSRARESIQRFSRDRICEEFYRFILT